MSMIFANFAEKERADDFARAVTAKTGREALVFHSYEDADAHDPFPFQFELPCVHVERIWKDGEGCIGEEEAEAMVSEFGGEFVGT